jgi:hypothetical protein
MTFKSSKKFDKSNPMLLKETSRQKDEESFFYFLPDLVIKIKFSGEHLSKNDSGFHNFDILILFISISIAWYETVSLNLLPSLLIILVMVE